MDSYPKITIEEKNSPRERIALEQRVSQEYDTAFKLLKKKSYKEALKKYKWVFSQPSRPERFLSTREIVRLIKGYPPALKVIKRWRNDKEKLIRAGKCDLLLINEWRDLNSGLGETNRSLEVFLKLKSAGADANLLKDIVRLIWVHFARAKEYNVLADYLPHLGFSIIHHAIQHDSMILFPDEEEDSNESRAWERDYHKTFMMEDGILSYEVALGLGKKSIAREFAKKILSVETSDRAFAGLIRAAIRTRSYDDAVNQYRAARDAFTPRKLKNTLKQIRRLPKSHLSQLRIRR